MGLITHEVPFLMTNHPVAYEGVDAGRPLEESMVLSVETTMLHPTRGFIKLEDTVAVTATGYEMFGDRGRGWNRGGAIERLRSLAGRVNALLPGGNSRKSGRSRKPSSGPAGE